MRITNNQASENTLNYRPDNLLVQLTKSMHTRMKRILSVNGRKTPVKT